MFPFLFPALTPATPPASVIQSNGARSGTKQHTAPLKSGRVANKVTRGAWRSASNLPKATVESLRALMESWSDYDRLIAERQPQTKENVSHAF